MNQESKFKGFEVKGVALRTPFHPFTANPWNAFMASIHSAEFQEAIFFASPDLHNKFIKDSKKIDDAILVSLFKYFLRMSFRCTPFGMFSGVSVAKIGKDTTLTLCEQKFYSKLTRMDNHFLNTFIQKILADKEIRCRIQWVTNNTIHFDFRKIRYVEYRLASNQRTHHLSEVAHSVYLESVLNKARNGATFDEIMKILVSDEVSEDEAASFLNEAIDCKLLLPELEPMVTGEEPYQRLLKILKKYDNTNQYIQFLEEIKTKMSLIDSLGPGADLKLHQEILRKIKDWDRDYDPKMVFQSDLCKRGKDMQLSQSVLNEISHSIEFLAKLNNFSGSPSLKKFKEEFVNRYEDREVPLMEALDVESGIKYPYGRKSQNYQSPLLQGVFLYGSSQASEYKVLTWQKRLIELYGKCIQEKEKEIILTDDAFSTDKVSFNEQKLPDSFSTMVSIIGSKKDLEQGNFLVDYQGSSEVSAANLLGRFCYASTDTNNLVNKLIFGEEQHHPDKVFAEIAHLAQARIGNVLLRPSLRKYEIPILTFSGVDNEHTINLNDLMISIKDGRILLRSKRLNREVVPRNTNAHNYSNDTIPYYHFLCDLQLQDSSFKLVWDWGMLNEFKFLPRVKYGKTILSKARWILDEGDLSVNSKSSDSDFRVAFEKYARVWQLPKLVILTQADNQLPLETQEDMCLKILRQELKRHKRVILQESLFNEDNLIVDGPEGRFTNELVIPWTKSQLLETKQAKAQKNSQSVQSTFVPGSEWHYIKIYCGTDTADLILTEVINPLVDELSQMGFILQWFFIRYNDPDNHLRVRFQGAKDILGLLTTALNDRLKSYLSNNLVWKIQTDTYKRELERYGHENIDNSELLFYFDSMATVQIIELLDGDEGDSLRWQFALRGINDMLQDFGYPLKQKSEFMLSLRNAFAVEFNAMNKESRKMLSDKYRTFRGEIDYILETDADINHEYYNVWSIFKTRSNNFAAIVGKIKQFVNDKSIISLDSLMGSYIHMFVNRFMKSNQRLHEFVMYDFLYNFYRSQLARDEQSQSSLNR